MQNCRRMIRFQAPRSTASLILALLALLFGSVVAGAQPSPPMPPAAGQFQDCKPFAGASACAVTASDFAVDQKKKKPAKKKPQKKKAAPKQPEPPKEAWQLPMKVVIVRSSEAGCEPVCPEWIMAEGEITTATPGVFRKALKQLGKRKLPVIIRSPGGQVNAALEIGRMIRKAKLDVAVGWTKYSGCAPADKTCTLPKERKGLYGGEIYVSGAFCASACPLILASGTRRLAGHGTIVGVHQIRTSWTQERITYRERYRIVNGKKKVIDRKIVSRKTVKAYDTYGLDKRLRKSLTAYLKEMGVDVALLDDMEKAPHSSIHVLDAGRQTELRLINVTDDASAYANSRLCGPALQVPVCVERTGFVQLPETAAASAVEVSKSASAAALNALGIEPADKPMIFAVVRDSSQGCEPKCSEWIAAQGVITPDTPRDLRLLLDQLGQSKLPVAFSSPGGDFDAAIAMARLIRANGLDTAVMGTGFDHCSPADDNCKSAGSFNIYKGHAITAGSKCNGACLFAAIGGKKLRGKEMQIIVHHPSLYVSRGDKRGADVQLMLHLAYMGIDKELLARMINLKEPQRLELTLEEKAKWLHMHSKANPSLFFARYKRPLETCYANTRPKACLPPELTN